MQEDVHSQGLIFGTVLKKTAIPVLPLNIVATLSVHKPKQVAYEKQSYGDVSNNVDARPPTFFRSYQDRFEREVLA